MKAMQDLTAGTKGVHNQAQCNSEVGYGGDTYSSGWILLSCHDCLWVEGRFVAEEICGVNTYGYRHMQRCYVVAELLTVIPTGQQ